MKAILTHLYVEQKLSQAAIAKKYSVSQVTVSRWLRNYGIPTRRSQPGSLHPAWRGGTKRSNGRYKVLRPEHPRADGGGYVYRNIVVWEDTNKKRVPSGYQVHHLNGIKSDDRPENLVAIPARDNHVWATTQAVQQRVRELERCGSPTIKCSWRLLGR